MYVTDVDLEGLQDLYEAVGRLPELSQSEFLEDLGTRLDLYIRERATQKLDTTRERYLADLKPVVVDPVEGIIRLSIDGFGAMTEEGYTSFDMRDTIIPPGEDYKIVRFRLKWPEARPGAGKQYGTRASDKLVGALGEEQATKLGRAMLRELRKRKYEIEGSGRKKWFTTELRSAESPRAGVKMRPSHAVGAFEGARKELVDTTRSGEGKGSAQYAIYRTISRNAGEGWIHPGYEGADIFGDAMNNLDQMVSEALKRFLK